MVLLNELSISWIESLNISNNNLSLRVIALDKILKIDFDGVLNTSISYQLVDTLNSDTELGNVIEIKHEYRPVYKKDIPLDPFSFNSKESFNIVYIEGDFIVKIICRNIYLTEIGSYPAN